jgi:hypothetical protein
LGDTFPLPSPSMKALLPVGPTRRDRSIEYLPARAGALVAMSALILERRVNTASILLF